MVSMFATLCICLGLRTLDCLLYALPYILKIGGYCFIKIFQCGLNILLYLHKVGTNCGVKAFLCFYRNSCNIGVVLFKAYACLFCGFYRLLGDFMEFRNALI